MAPEQTGGDSVGPAADLFSLGCVLYRGVTGQQPFRSQSAMGVMYAVNHHAPPAPCEMDPSVPRPLSDLIMHLLAKKPQDRPGSAAEVAVRLRTMAGSDGETQTFPVPRRQRARAVLVAAV